MLADRVSFARCKRNWFGATLLGIVVSACATTPDAPALIEAEFHEARANCGLPRMLMQPAQSDPRVLLFRFPQRYDALSTAEGNGRWACLQHWARERGFTLRAASHTELQGE